MPLINAVVESLADVKTGQTDLVITDGDDTMFPKGSDEPFPEVLSFLELVNPKCLYLVSDDPNKALAERRANAIEADGFEVPKNFPHWIKYAHFNRVISRAGRVDSALVLGNRWLMDVGVARMALQHAGIPSEGYLIHRPEAYREHFDTFIINPIQFAGASLVKRVGMDHYFRPRST